MQKIESELKELIIDSLNLEDIQPDDIISDEPLFVDGLGLDSIDALELGIAIKKKFNVVLDGDSEATRKHFSSVKNLAAFIASQVVGG